MARLRFASVLTPALAACVSPPTAPPLPLGALTRAESLYADLRDKRDRLDVSIAAGGNSAADGRSVTELARDHNRLRGQLVVYLVGVDSSALHGEDARALGIMRRTLEGDL